MSETDNFQKAITKLLEDNCGLPGGMKLNKNSLAQWRSALKTKLIEYGHDNATVNFTVLSPMKMRVEIISGDKIAIRELDWAA
jgi:hypothetical protein